MTRAPWCLGFFLWMGVLRWGLGGARVLVPGVVGGWWSLMMRIPGGISIVRGGRVLPHLKTLRPSLSVMLLLCGPRPDLLCRHEGEVVLASDVCCVWLRQVSGPLPLSQVRL